MTRRNWIFIFAFVAGVALTFTILRPAIKERPKTKPPSPELIADFEEEDVVEPSVPDPETFVSGEGPYQEGYKIGFSSFKAQNFGFSIPATEYTSSRLEESEKESEEYGKGYVDGYHKATEVMSCVCPY